MKPLEKCGTYPPDKAWLVESCPDFWFMPVIFSDKLFFEMGEISDKNSLASLISRGATVNEMVPCEDNEASEANWYAIDAYYGYPATDSESIDAARSLGKSVVPFKTVNVFKKDIVESTT